MLFPVLRSPVNANMGCIKCRLWIILTAAFVPLASASSSAPQWEHLLQEAQQHLGIPEPQALHTLPEWSEGVGVTRALEGAGFHQTLAVNVTVPAAAGSGASCRLALLQPLPPDFYADPYQLEDLARSKAAFSFKLLGPLDLELCVGPWRGLRQPCMAAHACIYLDGLDLHILIKAAVSLQNLSATPLHGHTL